MISMLTVLPALLAICGRRAFWSPGLDTIPHSGQDGRRRDARLLAPGRRPRRAPAAHDLDHRLDRAARCSPPTSSTSTRARRPATVPRRGRLRRGPGGARAQLPGRRVRAGRRDRAPTRARPRRSTAALEAAARPGRRRCARPARARPACSSSVTLKGDPYASATLDTMPELREVAKRAGGDDVLVGGPTAQEYDLRVSATRDNQLIIPLTLLVVLRDPGRAAARAGRAVAADRSR